MTLVNDINDVIAVLSETLDFDTGKITESSDLRELGMDSLDAIEIIMSFEDDYAISVEDDEIDHIKTVGDIIVMLNKKIQQKKKEAEATKAKDVQLRQGDFNRPTHYRNSMGEMTEIAWPRGVIIAQCRDVSMLWQGPDQYAVVYGLQIRKDLTEANAAVEFGWNILHQARCEGRI